MWPSLCKQARTFLYQSRAGLLTGRCLSWANSVSSLLMCLTETRVWVHVKATSVASALPVLLLGEKDRKTALWLVASVN